MKNRKLTSVLAGVMLAAVLMTGCSGKGLDGSQVAATVGGEEISLGLANFTAGSSRHRQRLIIKPISETACGARISAE